jgi:hypothetical protein
LVPRVYMLLRLAFLEARRRTQILDGGHLARVHVFKDRLPMMHRDGWDGPRNDSAVAFAWFAWNREHRGAANVQRIGIPRCLVCGERFVARDGALTCSPACRQKAYRKRHVTDRRRVADYV